jgi:hypothetical protein
MNRQLTLRLFGIMVAAFPFALLVANSYQRKAAEIAADSQAFLANQITAANRSFWFHYVAAVCIVAGVCAVVELTARVIDRVLPSRPNE